MANLELGGPSGPEKFRIEESETSPLVLARNETILHVADKLHTTPPKWDKVFAEINEDPKLHNHRSVLGAAGEVHVKQVVDEFANEPEIADAIKLNPLKDSGDSKYEFRESDKGNLMAFNKETKRSEAEYDLFLEAEGVPVIGEVRMTKYRTVGPGQEEGLAPLIKPNKISKKLAPIREHYREEGNEQEKYGFMAVTVPDVVLPSYHSGKYEGKGDPLENSIEERFIKRGGVIVTLPFTFDELEDEVHFYRRTAPGMRGSTSELTSKSMRDQLMAKFSQKAK